MSYQLHGLIGFFYRFDYCKLYLDLFLMKNKKGTIFYESIICSSVLVPDPLGILEKLKQDPVRLRNGSVDPDQDQIKLYSKHCFFRIN